MYGANIIPTKIAEEFFCGKSQTNSKIQVEMERTQVSWNNFQNEKLSLVWKTKVMLPGSNTHYRVVSAWCGTDIEMDK